MEDLKSGFKTSEFVMLLGKTVAAILLMLNVIDQDIATTVESVVVQLGTTVAGFIALYMMYREYVRSRTELKVNHEKASVALKTITQK